MNYDNTNLKKAKNEIDLLRYIEAAAITKSKRIGKNNFINPCPFCGKKDHFTVNTEKNLYKSFADCCKGGSIVDFIMEYENLDKKDAINKVLRLAGYDVQSFSRNEYKQNNKNVDKDKSEKIEEGETINNMNINFNKLIEKLHKNIGQTDYFIKRGLSEKTIKKYKLGYSQEGLNFAINNCEQLKETENEIYKAYRYYLPIWDEEENCSYFITRIDEGAVTEGTKVKNKTHNLKDFPVQLFNQRYLLNKNEIEDKYIFVVEGIFDALSLEEIGYKSIALNSNSNVKKLIEILDTNKEELKDKTFILIPDNDAAGEKSMNSMIEGFKRLNLCLWVCKLTDNFKDANEFLQNDRSKFYEYIQDFISLKINEGFNICYFREFINNIDRGKSEKIIKSGIGSIDRVLGGGIYPGLYTIGAISSLGKTTLIHQISDYIASQGDDVLYFSLEMGREELMRKSISREMFLINKLKGATVREIKTGSCDYETLNKAMESYKNIASNIAIIEGNFDTGVAQIREIIKRNINIRDKKPLVVIDYLQILKPVKFNMSDKQANDFNVTELKKISRDFNIPIIAISSLNRMNYTTAVGYESFKETGAIEYSSDVVIGLQIKGFDKVAKLKSETEKRNMLNDLKAKNPREIEFVVLKQREGIAYDTCYLKYIPKYNYFCE